VGICGCCDNCVGVLVICALVFTLFCIVGGTVFVFLFVLFLLCIFLFVTSVRTTATE